MRDYVKTTLRLVAALAIVAGVAILGACSTAPNANGELTSSGFYTVVQGDTLYGIARKFGRTVSSLVHMNGLKGRNDIKVGQVLRVDLIHSKAPAAPVRRMQNKATVADKEDAEPVEPALRDWVWPTDGVQTANFGAKKGIEISGKSGQEVRAANAGSVSFVGGGIRGYGNLVILKHPGNMLSVYAHNKTVVVKEGQSVIKGQKIAEMGDSDSDTVKLYFEIRRNGKPVDPSDFLPKR